MNVSSLGTAAITLLACHFFTGLANAQDISTLKPCVTNAGTVTARQSLTVPAVGVESEAEVGRSMVATFNIGVRPETLTLQRDVTLEGEYLGADFTVSIPQGEMKSNGSVFVPKSFTFEYKSALARMGAMGNKPLLNVTADQSSGKVEAHLFFGSAQRALPIDASATRIENCLASGLGGFRRELVYSGVSQGTVKLLYREYVDDMARPAFSQDLNYDLREGNEIGFKGARFKIFNASNVSIKYAVSKPLD